ncbi:MAG: carbohydrate ABC transporter permease [Oscillospiraceae bacterium]|nr:carbohydrate ABC transporter permease [Oscillospiraceae bacterium]
MRRHRHRIFQSKFDLILNIGVIVACVFSIFPLYWLFTGSVKYSNDITKLPPDWFPSRFTLKNFQRIFESYPAWRWLLNSFLITTITVLCILLVSALAAYALSKLRFPGKRLLFNINIACLLIPIEIYVLSLYRFVHGAGMQGTYWGYILPCVVYPMGVYLLKNFYDEIPDAIVEASELDGCGRLRFFFKHALPLSKPGLGALAILSYVNVWNNYLWQLLMATNDDKSLTVVVGLARVINSTGTGTADQSFFDFGLQYATATFTAIPMLIVFIIFQKYFTAGISAGAVKG